MNETQNHASTAHPAQSRTPTQSDSDASNDALPMQTPQIVDRPTEAQVHADALKLGLTPLQAQLVANRMHPRDFGDAITSEVDRLTAIEQRVFPKLKHLQHPKALHNIDLGAQLIADAIQSHGRIVIATDYDTDGVTSAGILSRALIDHFGVEPARVVHVISERRYGYGINSEAVARILQLDGPIALVISADQGSSDETRIAQLKAHNIAVCVTDHHQMAEEGSPASAACVINPQQNACQYDSTIAGCFVAFLVMTQTRKVLIERGVLAADTPSLKDLLDLVALGTVADSVSLKSPNNRAVVQAGLQAINQQTAPCWQALHQFHDNYGQPADAQYLGFQVATRINAASRVSDVTTAFDFINAQSVDEASAYLQKLDQNNQDRRSQQSDLLAQAQQQAQALYHPQKFSLCVLLQGNAGIQGIIATRIGEQYHCPTLAMTDLEDGTLAGSGRAILPEIDLKEAFDQIANQHPGLFRSRGGHKGAAGCVIEKAQLSAFSQALEAAIKHQLQGQKPTPKIETDGRLSPEQLSLDTYRQIKQLEPFGRLWPAPVFHGDFILTHLRWIGQDKTHALLQLKAPNQQVFEGIFFNAVKDTHTPFAFALGNVVHTVYALNQKQFRGRTSLQLRIIHMAHP